MGATSDKVQGQAKEVAGIVTGDEDREAQGKAHASTWDQVVFRGDAASREFLAFWLHQGRVLATMNANIWDQGDALDTLLGSGATPSPEHLADPTVDLADLVPADGT